MIQAGQLTHRGIIQSATITRDTDGGIIRTWATYKTRWFQILPLSGREFIAGQQVNSEMTHTLKCRYTSGVTNQMRLLVGTRVFEFLAVMNWGETNEETRIIAKEIL